MQLTANTTAEGNAGGTIGNFWQMIQSMGAGKSGASDSNAINGVAGSADGNPFSQILLQQLAMLLQASGIELSDTSTSKQGLISALQKLFESDQSATDTVWAGLAQLAMTGQQITQSVESALTATDISDVNDKAATTGMTQAKDYLAAGQLTSFIVQAIKDGLREAASKSDHQSAVKTEALNAGNTIDKTLKENTAEGFVAEIESLLDKKTGNADLGNNARSKEESLLKTDFSSTPPQAPIDLKTTLSSPDSVQNVEAGQMNIKSKNTVSEIQGEKSAVEDASVESRLGKVAVDVKTIVPEQAAKFSVAGKEKAGGEDSQILNAADSGGKDAAKKGPSESDALNHDRNTEVFGKDTKNNAAGKEGNQNLSVSLASQAAAEKTKPELKTRTGNTEKNTDTNYLNAAATSSGVASKQESGDTSSTSIINRVAAEFRENLMSEGGRVKITLTPPSLGSLEMDVSVINSKVKVMLIAESKDVQKLLSGSIETLKTTLQTQGLTIERCDVMMQDNRDEYQQGFNGRQAFGQEQAQGERNSHPQTLEDESSKRPSIASVQAPVRRPQYTGSESISLFA